MLHSGSVPWEIFCVFIITMCVVNCAPRGNLLYKSIFEPLGLRTVDYNENKYFSEISQNMTRLEVHIQMIEYRQIVTK